MSKSTISTFELFQMFPDAEAERLLAEDVDTTFTKDQLKHWQDQ